MSWSPFKGLEAGCLELVVDKPRGVGDLLPIQEFLLGNWVEILDRGFQCAGVKPINLLASICILRERFGFDLQVNPKWRKFLWVIYHVTTCWG